MLRSLVIILGALLLRSGDATTDKTPSGNVCPGFILDTKGPRPYKIAPGASAFFLVEISQHQLKKANNVVYKLSLPENLSFVKADVLGALSKKVRRIVAGSNLYWTGLIAKKGGAIKLRIMVSTRFTVFEGFMSQILSGCSLTAPSPSYVL